ncbi:MAG: co-chaperone DjlA [Hahellaceae bacterium]|nr:co-chaperone DjlA [Hahellaceae bacterium]
MSWWGKLIGGTFGYLVGGPLGALVGVALGHNLDASSRRHASAQGTESEGGQERVQMAFFTATFAVMGAVAKADGQVTRDEIQLAEQVMRQMQLPPDMRQAAIRLFNEGKQTRFPLKGVIDQLRRECHRRTNLLRMFLEIQVQAAYVDGQIHPAESALLLEITHWLGFQEQTLRQIEVLIRSGQRTGQTHGHQTQNPRNEGLTRDEAYAILGVSPSSSQDEVKKAYRRLMSQHHPDKLVAKGLPEEMMKLATEKAQQIREAYERVKS